MPADNFLKNKPLIKFQSFIHQSRESNQNKDRWLFQRCVWMWIPHIRHWSNQRAITKSKTAARTILQHYKMNETRVSKWKDGSYLRIDFLEVGVVLVDFEVKFGWRDRQRSAGRYSRRDQLGSAAQIHRSCRIQNAKCKRLYFMLSFKPVPDQFLDEFHRLILIS